MHRLTPAVWRNKCGLTCDFCCRCTNATRPAAIWPHTFWSRPLADKKRIILPRDSTTALFKNVEKNIYFDKHVSSIVLRHQPGFTPSADRPWRPKKSPVEHYVEHYCVAGFGHELQCLRLAGDRVGTSLYCKLISFFFAAIKLHNRWLNAAANDYTLHTVACPCFFA